MNVNKVNTAKPVAFGNLVGNINFAELAMTNAKIYKSVVAYGKMTNQAVHDAGNNLTELMWRLRKQPSKNGRSDFYMLQVMKPKNAGEDRSVGTTYYTYNKGYNLQLYGASAETANKAELLADSNEIIKNYIAHQNPKLDPSKLVLKA